MREHLAAGVPDQRLETLPAAYERLLLETELELDPEEVRRLRGFAPGFAELCAELDAAGLPATVQHDDLHDANVFELDGRFTILDWGDCAVGHPLATMFVTLRTVAHVHSLQPGDPWLVRLRDAFLEPWEVSIETFETAQQVAAFSRALSWRRIEEAMTPSERAEHHEPFALGVRRFLEIVGRG